MNSASGTVRTLLRLEGLAVLALSIAVYAHVSPHGWRLFLALFLVPDVSLAGYLMGPKTGAIVYNAGHTYVVPALLGGVAAYWLGPFWLAVALIWIAHIGMDRAIGYGLKFAGSFSDTHLGPIGNRR